jgi:hypothetical protein
MLLTWRNQLGYPAHTGLISLSVHLFVCLFVRYLYEHIEFSCRILNQGAYVEFSVCCSPPPNTNSYVQEENSGSTRKFVEKHLLFRCITNQILALCTIHPQSVVGLEKLFQGSVRKVPPAHVQWVFLPLLYFLGLLL